MGRMSVFVSWLTLFFVQLIFCITKGSLVLNETFQDISKTWKQHINGKTGVVKLVEASSLFPDSNLPKVNYLFTNISQCGSGHCYRAELAYGDRKNLANSRLKIFPDNKAEYWFGTSIYIPSNWAYNQADDKIYSTAYHFQLHGGDNAGNNPILGLKQVNKKFVISICGNTQRLEYQQCFSKNVGLVIVGEWIDFVVHSKLAYGTPHGFVEVWRNGELVMNSTNVITAYDEVKPPYLILGSYQINWKFHNTKNIGYDWIACYHKAVRVGLSDSNYAEVYTGNGQDCGTICEEIDSDNNGGLMDSFLRSSIATHGYLWAVIPLSMIVSLSIILCFSNVEFNRKVRQIALEKQEEEEDNPKGRGLLVSRMGRGSPLSYSRFINPRELWEEQQSQQHPTTEALTWSDMLKNESQTRTAFWTWFSVFMLILVFSIALLAYGTPYLNAYTYVMTGVVPSKDFSKWDILKVTMIVISGTMTAIYFIPLYYLQHDFEAGRKWVNDPHFLKRIGVVIPCHKSAKEIGEVLRRVLVYLPAENIVVCDNGNFNFPPDNTFEVVKSVDPHIRYVYIQQGHKTRALWTGVHRLPSHVEYIIHLDDDTHFDDQHMVFDESHFDEKHVVAIGFLRSCYPHNMVTRLTDFWYKITDHFHATQAKIATRCFVPGPAGMWRRDKFIEIFGKHPTLPFGEDIFGGYTTLNNGYAIRAETRCMVRTFAPDIFLPWFVNPLTARVQGYGASSLWKQRAHRWTVSAFRITGKSLYSFFTYDTKLGLFSNIAFRLYRFREYKLIFTQLLFIPILIVFVARGLYAEFLVMKALLFVLPLTRNVYINYICWRNQPDLQVPWYIVALSPLYNYFLIFCAIHGRWKCILWYLPWVAPNHGMLQRCRPKPLKVVPEATYSDKSPIKQIHVEREEGEGVKDAEPSPKPSPGASMKTSSRDSINLAFNEFDEDVSTSTIVQSPAGAAPPQTEEGLFDTLEKNQSVISILDEESIKMKDQGNGDSTVIDPIETTPKPTTNPVASPMAFSKNSMLAEKLRMHYKANDACSFEIFNPKDGSSKILDYYQSKAQKEYFIESEDDLEQQQRQQHDIHNPFSLDLNDLEIQPFSLDDLPEQEGISLRMPRDVVGTPLGMSSVHSKGSINNTVQRRKNLRFSSDQGDSHHQQQQPQHSSHQRNMENFERISPFSISESISQSISRTFSFSSARRNNNFFSPVSAGLVPEFVDLEERKALILSPHSLEDDEDTDEGEKEERGGGGGGGGGPEKPKGSEKKGISPIGRVNETIAL